MYSEVASESTLSQSYTFDRNNNYYYYMYYCYRTAIDLLCVCGPAAGLRHADSGRIRCVLPDVRHYNDDDDSVVLQVFSKWICFTHEALSRRRA